MKKTSKKKQNRKALRTVLLIVAVLCLCVAAFAGYKIISSISVYNESEDTYEDYRNLFKPSDSTQTTEEGEYVDPDFSWDYDTLKANCKDGVGYIKMRCNDGDTVDYPIVATTDNSYYLDHLCDGTPNACGAIFVDCNIDDGIHNRSCIIYGHRLVNGKMFGNLTKLADESYYEGHDIFDIYIEYDHYVYQVFAAMETPVDSEIYRINMNDEEFMTHIQYMLDNSNYDTGFTIDDFSVDSKIITLSTCTDSHNSAYRFVVCLVRIQ